MEKVKGGKHMVTELIVCILFSVVPLALMVGIIVIEVIKLSKKASHEPPVCKKVEKDHKRNTQVLPLKKCVHKIAEIHFEYPNVMDYQLLKPETKLIFRRTLWKMTHRLMINGESNQRAGP